MLSFTSSPSTFSLFYFLFLFLFLLLLSIPQRFYRVMHSSVSLLPLLSFLPFVYVEKTSTLFVLVSYFSTSVISELGHGYVLPSEVMDFTRLCGKMLDRGRVHVLASLALSELYRDMYLHSPRTLKSTDEWAIPLLYIVIGLLLIGLNVMFQRKTEAIVTPSIKTRLFEVVLSFVICHILPMVKHFNQTGFECLPIGMKIYAIYCIFCNIIVHVVACFDFVFWYGSKKQSDIPTASSKHSDGANRSPDTPVKCRMIDLVQEVPRSGEFRAEPIQQMTDDLSQELSRYERDGNCTPILTHALLNLIVSIGQIMLANDTSHQYVETAATVDDEPKDSYTNRLSELDNLCLERIAEQVTNYKDFMAFSEVCRSSRNACSNMDWNKGPKLPCLMLSENSSSPTESFFNVHNNTSFVTELPAAAGRCIWGSPHGWLVTVDREFVAQLMNPISQVQVNLPPFPTMQNQLARGNRFHGIRKILVFKVKIDKFLVMVIFHPENLLAFTRVPGDGEWVWVSNPHKLLFRDISYLRGQGRVYAICDDGSLVKIEFAFHSISSKMSSTVNKLMEFSGPLSAKVELIAAHPIGEFVGPLPEMERTGRAYLVASPDDDLFVVFRYSEDMGTDQRTVEFAVYRFNPRGFGWERVVSIGDKAFFVGNNTSWSIFSASTVNLRSNSVYFTDDNWELEWLQNGRGLDIGIYDMETRRTEGLGFDVSASTTSHLRSAWITPGLTPSTFR